MIFKTTTICVGDPIKRKQIRNRWLVAYTLLKNPDLVQYRRNGITAEQRQELSLLKFMAEQQIVTALNKYEAVEEWKAKLGHKYHFDALVSEYVQEIVTKLTEKGYECKDLSVCAKGDGKGCGDGYGYDSRNECSNGNDVIKTNDAFQEDDIELRNMSSPSDVTVRL